MSVAFQFVKIYTDFSFFPIFSTVNRTDIQLSFLQISCIKLSIAGLYEYIWKLRDEVLYRTLWKIRFGRDCGRAVR